nr:type II CAAX endopeptidase family protein [Bacillus rubiinfantis]
MKNLALDFRLIFGVILAHLLLYFSFYDKAIFWYIFTGSILVLITYSMLQGDVDDDLSFLYYLFLGIISGLLLYAVIWLGNFLIHVAALPFDKEIKNLYKWFAPSLFWHYLALVLVAAPGEELFWRGFVQKRLLRYVKPAFAIITGALLYASVNIYTGSILLVLASFLSGIVWGTLYYRKKSMPLVIVSHIIFDLLIFIILPLT